MRVCWMIVRALLLVSATAAIARAQDRPAPASVTQAGTPNRTSFDRDDRLSQPRLVDPRVRTPIPPGFPFGLEWDSWARGGAAASGNPDPGFRNTPTQTP